MSELDNNFEPPKADLENNQLVDSDVMLKNPKLVSPARGFHWLERGLSDVIMPQFSKWFIAGLVYAAISLMIALINQNLSIVFVILNPIIVGGAILGAHAAYQKQAIPPMQMFKAFTHANKLPLMLYVLLQLLMLFAAVYFVMTFIGLETFKSVDWVKFQNPEQQAYQEKVFGLLLPALKPALFSGLLFFFATWFVPSLILLQKQNPLFAIGKSFYGAIKNILAFLVFILIFIIIMVIIGIVIAIVSSLLGAISVTITQIVINLAMTAIMLPVLAATAYIGYREIFLGDEGEKKESLQL